MSAVVKDGNNTNNANVATLSYVARKQERKPINDDWARLGVELRTLRKQTGLTLDNFGRQPDGNQVWSHSRLSEAELGISKVAEELVRWYAERAGESPARLLAQRRAAAGGLDSPDMQQDADAWHNQWELEAADYRMRLNSDPVEIYEIRDMRALVDDIDEYVTWGKGYGDEQVDRFTTETLEGGSAPDITVVSEQLVRFTIRLPRSFRLNERHHLVFRHHAPKDCIAPFFTTNPRRPVGQFRCTVVFPPGHQPWSVWRLEQLQTPFVLDLFQKGNGQPELVLPESARLTPDCFGAVQVLFHDLQPSFEYGIGWVPEHPS